MFTPAYRASVKSSMLVKRRYFQHGRLAILHADLQITWQLNIKSTERSTHVLLAAIVLR